MKPKYTYLIPLFATLLQACDNEAPLVDESPEEQPVCAISFDQSMVDRVTRTNISLSDYASTMGVWGFRNPDTDNECVFMHQLVQYDTQTNDWTYSPLKYWEPKSSYDFYAYSPYDTARVRLDTTAPRAYLVFIDNIELTGVNLQEEPAPYEKMLFRGTTDTDWMVARTGQKDILGSAREHVQFRMQHILSKLNVSIRISDLLENTEGIDSITLDQLAIGNFIAEGDFHQQLDNSPITHEEKAEDEWHLGDKVVTLQRKRACKLTSTPHYVLESLVIPQENQPTDKLQLAYTLHYTDHTEKFKFERFIPAISSEMTHFYSGYNYTVNFLIDPDRITFTAKTVKWEEK